MEENSLERKEGLLYKKESLSLGDEVIVPHKLRDLNLPKSWTTSLDMGSAEAKKSSSFGVKLLFGSLFVFLMAGAFATWQFTSHKNSVSADKIVFTLTTNAYIEGGEVGTLGVVVNNQNTLPLVDAQLVVSYEKGIGENNSSKQVKTVIPLGTINSQELKKQEVQFSVYGAENERRDIVVRLQYKVEGASAIFTKDSLASVFLKTPPVTVHITGDTMVTPTDTATFQITVKNNTSTGTMPLLVSLTLPVMFDIISSSATPFPKTTVWKVDKLSPGQEYVINIRGSFSGSPGEKVSMKAVVGPSSGDLYSIDPVFSMETKDIILSASGITVTFLAETDRGESKDLRLGDRVHMRVRYSNTGSTTLSNGTITLVYKGVSIDPASVSMGDNGYYDSSRNTILWNQGTSGELAYIAPGARGEFTFYFSVPQMSDTKNISFDVSADAENETSQVSVNAHLSKTYPIGGSISLNSYLIYNSGSFKNTGFVPPQVGKITTYTIKLIASSQTEISQAKVVFTLPVYVTWLGAQSTQATTYDPKTRLVSWNIGKVLSNSPMTNEIQISVKPSQTHFGLSPNVTSGMTFIGVEQSTNNKVERTIDPVTTEIKEVGGGINSGTVERG